MWKFSLRNSCDLFVLSDATPEQNDVLDVAHDSWEETSDGFLKSPVIAVVLEGDAYYTSGDVIDYHLVGFEPIVSPYGKQLHKNGVVQLTAGSNLHWICFTPRRGFSLEYDYFQGSHAPYVTTKENTYAVVLKGNVVLGGSLLPKWHIVKKKDPGQIVFDSVSEDAVIYYVWAR